MSLTEYKKRIALSFAAGATLLSFSTLSASADVVVQKGSLADLINQVAPTAALNTNVPAQITPIGDGDYEVRMMLQDGVGSGGGSFGLSLRYSTGGLGWH
jgi:hypothetical protein